MLCLLIEGGTKRDLTAARAEQLLASTPAGNPVIVERLAVAREMLDEIHVLDTARADFRKRTATVIVASATSVTDVYGIGTLMAAIIIGRVGDIGRFPTGGHFARHRPDRSVIGAEETTPAQPAR